MTYLQFGVVVGKEQGGSQDRRTAAATQGEPRDLFYPNPEEHDEFVARIKRSVLKPEKD